jgi:diadenosine tetraphosphate (Ap4A) HIT family hydrolase
MAIIHAQFIQDSILVKQYDEFMVRLINDQRFPWVLVIPTYDVVEFHDVPWPKAEALTKFLHQLSANMKQEFKADKMNLATLGNVVPQLHFHLIARYTSDAAWPKPVWGQGTQELYKEDALEVMIRRVENCLPGSSPSRG